MGCLRGAALGSGDERSEGSVWESDSSVDYDLQKVTRALAVPVSTAMRLTV